LCGKLIGESKRNERGKGREGKKKVREDIHLKKRAVDRQAEDDELPS
jgi:hypothetical protein